MPTNTAAVVPAARQDPRQVVNTLKKTINWNDAGVADGVAFDNSLPQGAFITQVLVEIVTLFDGAGPVLVVGTNATDYNDIVASGDVSEGSAAVTAVTRALGRSLCASADKTPYAKLTLSGASQGQAVITILYEGGNSPS